MVSRVKTAEYDLLLVKLCFKLFIYKFQTPPSRDYFNHARGNIRIKFVLVIVLRS